MATVSPMANLQLRRRRGHRRSTLYVFAAQSAQEIPESGCIANLELKIDLGRLLRRSRV